MQKTVHFKVHFDGMNELLRDGWAEGKFKWCFDFIEGMGVSREQGIEVVRGNLRFAQDPEGRDGIDGMLDDDTFDPNTYYSYYVDPDDLASYAAKGFSAEKEIPRLQDLAITTLKRMMREGRGDGVYLEEIDFLLKTFPKEALKRNEIEIRNMRPKESPGREILVHGNNSGGFVTNRDLARGLTRSDPQLKALGLPSLDEFVSTQLALDTKKLPDPDPDCESLNGYITPDGSFYPCEWMEHVWLEAMLMNTPLPKFATWQLVKVFQSQMNPEINFGYDIPYQPGIDIKYNPKEKQLETLMYWCAKHGVEYKE